MKKKNVFQKIGSIAKKLFDGVKFVGKVIGKIVGGVIGIFIPRQRYYNEFAKACPPGPIIITKETESQKQEHKEPKQQEQQNETKNIDEKAQNKFDINPAKIDKEDLIKMLNEIDEKDIPKWSQLAVKVLCSKAAENVSKDGIESIPLPNGKSLECCSYFTIDESGPPRLMRNIYIKDTDGKKINSFDLQSATKKDWDNLNQIIRNEKANQTGRDEPHVSNNPPTVEEVIKHFDKCSVIMENGKPKINAEFISPIMLPNGKSIVASNDVRVENGSPIIYKRYYLYNENGNPEKLLYKTGMDQRGSMENIEEAIKEAYCPKEKTLDYEINKASKEASNKKRSEQKKEKTNSSRDDR